MARRPNASHVKLLDWLLARLSAEDAARTADQSNLTDRERRVALRDVAGSSVDERWQRIMDGTWPFSNPMSIPADTSCDALQRMYEDARVKSGDSILKNSLLEIFR